MARLTLTHVYSLTLCLTLSLVLDPLLGKKQTRTRSSQTPYVNSQPSTLLPPSTMTTAMKQQSLKHTNTAATPSHNEEKLGHWIFSTLRAGMINVAPLIRNGSLAAAQGCRLLRPAACTRTKVAHTDTQMHTQRRYKYTLERLANGERNTMKYGLCIWASEHKRARTHTEAHSHSTAGLAGSFHSFSPVLAAVAGRLL